MTDRSTIAATASEPYTPAIQVACGLLEAAGYAVRRFAAGSEMEAFVKDGHAVGVLDLATRELVGGTAGGSNRLTAAGMAGVPQVISLGGLDAAAFGRTTPEECDKLGQEVAMKACAARGPTAILVPLRGLSARDIDGGPTCWPEANAALFQSLRNWVYGVELVEFDLHVTDAAFGRACAETLLRLLRVTNVSQS